MLILGRGGLRSGGYGNCAVFAWPPRGGSAQTGTSCHNAGQRPARRGGGGFGPRQASDVPRSAWPGRYPLQDRAGRLTQSVLFSRRRSVRLAHFRSLPKSPRRAALPGSAGLRRCQGRWKGTVPGVTGRGRKADSAFALPGVAEQPFLPVPGFSRHLPPVLLRERCGGRRSVPGRRVGARRGQVGRS